MQSENPLFADLSKLLNSAAGTLAGMGREGRDAAREKMREVMGGLDFVSRDEFEAVKAMAAKAREQADALEARLAVLEAGGAAPIKSGKSKPGAGITD
ncbi:MAG TPA: accessory factor UbiK family protein [Novosphingobium sp.]|nr:accessory factor UbiK family protein [Novosphingobium sp.]